MMTVYPAILEQTAKNKKNEMSGQMSLLDFLGEEEKTDFEIRYPNVEEYSKEEMLAKEKEILGMYISGHPLDDYMDILGERVTAKSTDFIMEEAPEFEDVQGAEMENSERLKDKESYTIGGIIADITRKITKNGDEMAFLSIEDVYGTVEVVVFARDYRMYKEKLVKDAKVLIHGNASIDERGGKLLFSKMALLDDIKADMDGEKKDLWLRFADMQMYENQIMNLYRILERYKGRTLVKVMITPTEEDRQKKIQKVKWLPDRYRVQVNEELIHILQTEFGKDNVKVVYKTENKQ